MTQVADIGFQGIELGLPNHDIQAEAIRDHLQKINLDVISLHTMLPQIEAEFDRLLHFLHILQVPYLVLSYSRFEDQADFVKQAKLYNEIGKRCQEHGVQFLYHNHDHEFVSFGEKNGFDLLMQETDPKLVQFELDTYWVKKGGYDPADYLSQLKNRCPLLHVKDMEKGEEQFFAEVGEGILNFPEILTSAEQAGTKWLIVEQDQCRRAPMTCIEVSYHNLKEMNYG
nr:sugar phosphate isomerase/epimerase [Gracilibacillus alcaliphilus]